MVIKPHLDQINKTQIRSIKPTLNEQLNLDSLNQQNLDWTKYVVCMASTRGKVEGNDTLDIDHLNPGASV